MHESTNPEPSAFDKFDAAMDGGAPTGAPSGAPVAPVGAPPAAPAGAPPAPAAGAPASPAPSGGSGIPGDDDDAGTPPAPGAAGAPAAGAEIPDKPPKFNTTAELRKFAYENHQARKAAEAKLTQLEKDKAALNQIDPKTEQERKALIAKNAESEKKIEEQENYIRLVNFSASDEYKNKYQAPYQAALDQADEVIKELFVKTEDEVTGEVGKRPANWNDFKYLYEMPLGLQAEAAHNMFGAAAPIAMQHIAEVKKHRRAMEAAQAHYKEKYVEIEQQRTAQVAQEREKAAEQHRQNTAMWEKVNSELAADPRGKDAWGKEGNPVLDAAVDKGLAFYDKRHNGAYAKMSIPERIKYDAFSRHRMAGFYKMHAKLQLTLTEVAQLKDTIAKMRGSAPGAPASPATNAPAGDDNASPMDKFNAL